ncbi:MAG: NYN domain-containing protein [Desulfobacteraceae bacterium]|nr:NYN domain-containing protein [Desulfobacteraceae bacterium]
MLKTGIYVDAENIRLSGGYGMRYDVLVDLANSGNSVLLRANSYLVEDRRRTEDDPEYRQKLYNYHDILRKCGFKLIKKYVKRYVDEDGVVTSKANADMDLAIDALLQSRNLDRIILLSGDGDFLRLVTAIQNKGCRVEVIGFNNVSHDLREAADRYVSGFLVPGLLPIANTPEGERWRRGTPLNYNPAKGFGFFRYYRLGPEGLVSDTVFFHRSKAPVELESQAFVNPMNIFEFRIAPNPMNDNRPEAWDIRTMSPDDHARRE